MRDFSPSADRMALAWGLAWFLAPLAVLAAASGLGPPGSVAYSNPERAAVAERVSLVVGYVVSIASWTIAAAATAGYLSRTFGADTRSVMRSAVGWGLGWIAALPLAASWARTWDAGFLAPIVGLGIAGSIAGALTIPVASRTGSALTLARMSVVNGLAWGVVFLLLSFLGFFAGYFLGLLGGGWGMLLGFVMSFGAAGFAAARTCQRVLVHVARYRSGPARAA